MYRFTFTDTSSRRDWIASANRSFTLRTPVKRSSCDGVFRLVLSCCRFGPNGMSPYGVSFTVYLAVRNVVGLSTIVASVAPDLMSPVYHDTVSSGLVNVGKSGLDQCHHS